MFLCYVTEGLLYWTIHTNSGDHVTIEEDIPPGADSLVTIRNIGHIVPTVVSVYWESQLSLCHFNYILTDCVYCWVTSYGWCCKGQIVDLCEQGGQPEVLDIIQPPIAVSVW